MDIRISRRMFVMMAAVLPSLNRGKHALAQSATPESSLRVTMVTHMNGLGDHGYSDLANAGGLRAAKELGVDFTVIESATPADFEPNVELGTDDGGLVVGVGDILNDAVSSVAAARPSAMLGIIDSSVEAPNVQSVIFREQEGYFLGGVLAGLTTKTGTIGVVGGMRVPPIIRSEVGFIAGVRSVSPNAEVLVTYADSFGDPALGKELALAQIANDADTILPIAGTTGNGAIQAAVDSDRSVRIIAADADKAVLAGSTQLAVVAKGIDDAMFDIVSRAVDGTFAGGLEVRGLAEHGMDLRLLDASVTDDQRRLIAAYREAIVAGTIVPPSTDDELAAFLPVSPEELQATPVARTHRGRALV